MFSARMTRRNPPVAQSHREEEAEISLLSRTRKMKIEEKNRHSESLPMVVATIQMIMTPMMRTGVTIGTNGGKKMKKKSLTLVAKTVPSLAQMKMKRILKQNLLSLEQDMHLGKPRMQDKRNTIRKQSKRRHTRKKQHAKRKSELRSQSSKKRLMEKRKIKTIQIST